MITFFCCSLLVPFPRFSFLIPRSSFLITHSSFLAPRKLLIPRKLKRSDVWPVIATATLSVVFGRSRWVGLSDGSAQAVESEVVAQVFLIDFRKMLLPIDKRRVLIVFKDDFSENVHRIDIVDIRRVADDAMRESVVENGFFSLPFLAHHFNLGIARHKGILAQELMQVEVRGEEAQRHAAKGIEGIELRQRAAVHLRPTTIDAEAIAKRVGNLAIHESDAAVHRAKAVALTVVNRGTVEREFFARNIRRIDQNAVESAVNVGELHPIFVGRRMETDAFPLAAHAVVRQIVEHSVDAVAPQDDVLIGIAQNVEPSEHVDACVGVEIERRACRNRQRGTFPDGDSTIYNNRCRARRQHRIATDFHIAKLQSIPRIDIQIDFLDDTAFKRENQVVIDEIRLSGVVVGRCNLDENADAVLVSHFDIVGLIAHRSTEVSAIDIDAETRLIAAFQADVRAADSLARAVINPHIATRRRHIAEHRVERDRVGREGQNPRGRRRETVVVATRGKQQQSGQRAKKDISVTHYCHNEKIAELLFNPQNEMFRNHKTKCIFFCFFKKCRV